MVSLEEAERQELLAKLEAYLEKKYDLRITGFSRLDRGVFRLDREKGASWIVRVFPTDRPVERAQGDAEILRFLEKHHFPAEKCAASEPVTSPGGRAVLVTEFIEGSKIVRDTPTLYKLGEMIGSLNNLPKGSGAVLREAGALHHYSRKEGKPRNELDNALSWLDDVKDSATSSSTLRESLREKVAKADRCEDLPEALIHPDPVLKNVLVTQKDNVWIDWTGAGLGPRIFSFSVLLFSGVLKEHGWSQEFVDAMVAGYRSQVELEEIELKRLANVMYIRPLVFACWAYRHAIKSGKQPDGSEWWWPSSELNAAIAHRAIVAFERR
jgi:Ser/Thr protein kinase RdoA (MazF antagonist)